MSTRRVNNQVRLAGRIAYMHFSEKMAVMVIDTGLSSDGAHTNYPRAIVFEKVLNVASRFKVGDYVLVDATMQSNKTGSNLPSRTIAVNHIGRLNPEDPRFHTVNRFDFYGKILNAEKIDDTKVKATMRIYTGQANYLTVYFESTNKEEIEEFVNLNSDNYVYLSGQIRTNKAVTEQNEVQFYDKLVATKFRKFK